MISTVNHILEKIEKNIRDQKELEYFWTHSSRYQCLLNKLSKYEKGKVLDVGCYPFHLGKALQELGWDVWGISSPHEPIYDDSQVKILNIDRESFPFEDNQFDMVLFTEVIEHLLNPQFSLKEIYRVLKKNGILILTTPNKISLLIAIRKIFLSGKGEKEDSSIYHRHNKEYTMEELKKTIEELGFKIKTAEYLISYTPFRKRKIPDPAFIKFIKFINFILMKLLPFFQDTLYLEAKKI